MRSSMKVSTASVWALTALLTLSACDLGGSGGGRRFNRPLPPPPPAAVPGELAFEVSTLAVPENAGSAALVVRRTGGSAGAVSVRVTSAEGTAGSGSDFEPLDATVSFGNGESAPVSVPLSVIDDGNAEPPETVLVTLSDVQGGATLGAVSTIAITIEDDESAPPPPPPPAGVFEVSASVLRVVEGVPSVTLTVNRTGGSSGAVSVQLATVANASTALAGVDYESLDATVSFGEGETSQTVTLVLLEDQDIEGEETLRIALSNPAGGAILGAASALTLTIEDNEVVAPPAGVLEIGASATRVEEGMSVTLTITRTGGSAGAVSVDLSSVGEALSGSDFELADAQVSFADADVAPKTRTLLIVDDADPESLETLTIALTNPTGGASAGARSEVTLTIVDDDVPPAGQIDLEASTLQVTEGPGASVILTVSRTDGSSGAVSLWLEQSGGSARAGEDFEAFATQVDFDDQDASARQVTLRLIDDATYEPSESLTVRLMVLSGEATLGVSTLTLTIEDDDLAPPPPPAGRIDLSASAVNIAESTRSVTLNVTRSGGDRDAVRVRLASVGGTATAGEEYEPLDTEISFADEEAGTKTATLTLIDDTADEPNETITLHLTLLDGEATLGVYEITLTIADDDSAPPPPPAGQIDLSASAVSIAEGAGSVTLNVTRSGGNRGEIRVRLATVGGTATVGEEYESLDTEFTFVDEEADTKTATLTLIDDAIDEPNETITLRLTLLDGEATLGVYEITLTITDDEEPSVLRFSVGSVSVEENALQRQVEIVRSGSVANAVEVRVSSADGVGESGASAGEDYTAVDQTLSFASGESSKLVTVEILNDDVFEDAETFTLSLSDPTNGATLGVPATTTLTIEDDDPLPTFSIGGTVTGLQGGTLILRNGLDQLEVTANGTFTFATEVGSGDAYNVTVAAHPSPPPQDCVVSNASGTANADVVNVGVVCTAMSVGELRADANVHSATLSWATPPEALRVNLYMFSARGCDIEEIDECPGGTVFTDVTSPHTVTGLNNGQAYFFRVEIVYPGSSRVLSNEAGARPDALVFDGVVRSIAPASDGTAYLGGEFTRVGILTGSAVLLDATGGQLAAPDFPIIDGTVLAIAPDGVGGWYVGGAFTQVGEESRSNLAHVLADGTVDMSFPDTDDSVHALAVSESGDTVFVGGRFTSVGGSPRRRLAAVAANGTVPDGWNIDVSGVEVHALAVSGNTVYVGGNFAAVGGQSRRNLAAFSAEDGTLSENWIASAQQPVYALAVSNDMVYVGGSFLGIDPTGGTAFLPRQNLAAIETNGLLTSDWTPSTDGQVTALAISGNTIYVGGRFTNVGGVQRARIAAISASDGAVSEWDPQVDRIGSVAVASVVSALAVRGNVVYVGGNFSEITTVAGSESRSHLAAISTEGRGQLTPWTQGSFGRAHGANRAVHALALSPVGETVYVGGEFTSVGGAERMHLASIDGSGALREDWNPRVTGMSPLFAGGAAVNALALSESESVLYVGGDFAEVDGIGRENLAAINAPSGEVLTSWNAGTTGTVFALAASNNTVYAGGRFTSAGAEGEGRGRLAAFDATTGALDTAWFPFADGVVRAIAVHSDTVYVGGEFANINGIFRRSLAAISSSGALNFNWQPSTNGFTYALALHPAGHTVYVGGEFTEGNFGQPRNNLAAIGSVNDDSGVLREWNPSAGGPVHALAFSDGVIYAGGTFSSMGTEGRSNLAKIAADATGEPQNWAPVTDGGVTAIAISGGTVHAGGFFGTLNGLPRNGFGSVSVSSGNVIP